MQSAHVSMGFATSLSVCNAQLTGDAPGMAEATRSVTPASVGSAGDSAGSAGSPHDPKIPGITP